MLYETAEKLTK